MQKLWNAIARHFFRTLVSLLIMAFFLAHALNYLRWSGIDALELLTYDARLNILLKQQPPAFDRRVVIVDIDEKSLKVLGRWPWRRSSLGDLVDSLFDHYKINILGFDAVFAEPDISSGLSTLEYLAQEQLKDNQDFLHVLQDMRSNLDFDQRFAKSLRNRRVVMGYTWLDAENSTSGQLPPADFPLSALENSFSQPYQALGYAGNLHILANASMSAGHFNSYPDNDGLTRHVPLLYGYDNKLYQSLSLAIARFVLNEPLTLDLSSPQGVQHLTGLRLGTRHIPLDPHLQALIPYQGKSGSFPYVSAVDVIFREADPALLNGAIVLLGTTAKGLFDLRATPVQEVYPGAEIHANLITGIMDGHILHKDQEHWELYQVLLSGLFMITLMLLLTPLWTASLAFLFSVLLFWVNLVIWQQYQLIIPLAPTMLMLTALFFFNLAYGYFVESRNKRQLTSLFGQYVPPQLVNEMSENPHADFSMEGDSREMTVLFSDVRGFTSISEGLEPKQLSRLMNTFLTPMTYIIHDHRGTIDKYMGDAIMAFWGAPLADAQHARRALDAGLKMIEKLEAMQPLFAQQGWPEVKIGVGLNTGVMSVGNMGSEFRMAYTVLGDAVNLGSRLEGLTKQYGVQIIVSESTRAAVPEYVYRELDRVRVKGKDLPIKIYEPLGDKANISAATRQEIENYEQALQHYREQAWEAATQEFAALAQAYPERKLYNIYLERSRHFQQSPPSTNWDGVFTHTSK